MASIEKIATASDVARRAGVSQATVSYVLSGRRQGASRISEETRRRVLDAVDELGYVPNHTAQSLRRRRTERVCLVLPSLGIPYCDALGRDLQHAADAYGYSMIIAVGGSPERERHALDQLRMRLADGAIIDSATIMADDLTPLMQANVALVVISNHLTAGPGFDVVRTTEAEASFEAVLYLLDRGHRRIAFLGHSDARWPHYERFSSYLRALESRGIPIDDGLIRGGAGSREQSHAAAMELLRLPNRPAAILAASDIGAISVIWAARDLGLRVPEDVAVMGFGNIPEGEIVRPSLTTVGPVHLQFGDVAELLFSRLKGEAPPAGRVHHHPWALIRRGSA